MLVVSVAAHAADEENRVAEVSEPGRLVRARTAGEQADRGGRVGRSFERALGRGDNVEHDVADHENGTLDSGVAPTLRRSVHRTMVTATRVVSERQPRNSARGVEAATDARAPDPAKLIVRAVGEIEAAGGDVAIAQLDALCGTSRRRLAAAFRDHVGVAPKRFARIVRFRRALKFVFESDAPLTAIAAQNGYYDQPHLNAEFRLHAEMTPQALRNARRYPDSSHLAEQIFQDDAPAPA